MATEGRACHAGHVPCGEPFVRELQRKRNMKSNISLDAPRVTPAGLLLTDSCASIIKEERGTLHNIRALGVSPRAAILY